MPYKRLLALLTALMLLMGLVPAMAEETGEEGENPAQLQLHQITIDCADAYLLTVGDIAIMIDGGNDTWHRPDKLMDYLRAAGFETLTAYIITHYHADHDGNFLLIMSEFGAEDTVVYGPSEALPEKFQPMPCGTYTPMRDGDRFTIGPLSFHCVGPSTLSAYNGAHNLDSLNFIVTYGARRFLFTGDYANSAAFLNQYADEVRDIDVLKFPHHGLESPENRNPFYIAKEALILCNPSMVLIPGAYAQVKKYLRSLRLSSVCFGNGDGNFIVFSDGTYLHAVANVQPGQYAGRDVPVEDATVK